MGVINVEELPRGSAQRRFGEPPTYERRWAVRVDDPATSENVVVNSVGVGFLAPHPEAFYCKAFNVTRDYLDGNRWLHVVTWKYEVPEQPDVDEHPLSRPDVWKWSSGGVEIPALTYYDSNDALRALVNTAGDFFEGLTEEESTLTARISGNRATYDYNLAASVTGALNNAPYLGWAKWCWKVGSISGEQAVEVVNEQEVRFYQIEVELTAKPSTWVLQLPNVGWNYISGGQKRRSFVWYDSGVAGEPLQMVPASNPQPLDASGNIVTAAPGESNPPMLLTRRTKKQINFVQYFGTPLN
ncbi:hypothetical protein UFOVP898_54 [uncultured Caudovirales phage]|uniref:Uncharacterized protein n=1 Tax=uncultured Caudovirales phage TaxID=2100421 RepID=A0A6J5SAU7_9CAUD|nr:hypothetical protein UFOVP898_54 [uncultured Caudovirales phage]CAB4176120.1 hypothetical protein UFOVP985_5 [uncultured Caudovirales phage]CAB4181665.1 hypothetical protein UFOVP1073_52 [uncultured Caudovirales phage]CAB4197516.1 hypothetical protein UFOVP1308_17 [uncultured Caudovirales phage]CAB4210839.1 hypothetical protein UFOVP1423_52 [uncultured Caudovirales phage]